MTDSGVMPEGAWVPEQGDDLGDLDDFAPPGMKWVDGPAGTGTRVLVPEELDVEDVPAEAFAPSTSPLDRLADAVEAQAAAVILQLAMPEDVMQKADAIMTRWLGKVTDR